jgi:hypothetical protein
LQFLFGFHSRLEQLEFQLLSGFQKQLIQLVADFFQLLLVPQYFFVNQWHFG